VSWPEAFAAVGCLASIAAMVWAFMKYSRDDE